MLSKWPDGIGTDDDVVPGGDIRQKGNSWLRSAFKATNLAGLPRETQFRGAIWKIVVKKKIGSLSD